MRLRSLTQLDRILAHIVSALGLTALLSAACDTASGSCTGGAEGCGCIQNECLGGLECSPDNICISPDGDGASGNGGATDGGVTTAGGRDDDGGGDSTGDSDGEVQCFDDQGSPIEDNQPPEIVELTVDTTTLSAQQDVRVTLVVADPDGVDDIERAGIQLASGKEIKEFGRVSSDTFSAELDWYDDLYYENYDELPLGQMIEFRALVSDGCDSAQEAFSLMVCESYYDECAAAEPDPGLSTPAQERPIELPSPELSLSFSDAAPAAQTVDPAAFSL